ASTTVATESGKDTSGSRQAATSATSPNPTNAASARPIRRAPTTPTTAAIASAASTMMTLSASLSFVPNSPTTTSFAPGGWRAKGGGCDPRVSSRNPRAPSWSASARGGGRDRPAPQEASMNDYERTTVTREQVDPVTTRGTVVRRTSGPTPLTVMQRAIALIF